MEYGTQGETDYYTKQHQRNRCHEVFGFISESNSQSGNGLIWRCINMNLPLTEVVVEQCWAPSCGDMDHVLLFCEVEWVGNTKTGVSGEHCGLARPPNSPALHLLPCDHHDHHWECGGRNNGLPFSASFMFFLNLCSCFHLYFYLYAYLSGLCLSALTSEECGKQEEEAKTCLSIIESHFHSPKLPTRFLPLFSTAIYSSRSGSF